MPTQIDHVVVVTRHLDEAIDGAQRAGFTVVPGGEHAGGQSHNALIAFRDGTYVELFAFIDPERQSAQALWTRLWQGSGLADFALLSASLDDELAAISERGVRYPDATDLGRLRPDGERLAWRMSVPSDSQTASGHGWPFLIEDTTPRSLRVPFGEHECTHANGAAGISGVILLVPNLTEGRAEFSAILDAEGGQEALDIPGIAAAHRFPVGNAVSQWLLVAEPDHEVGHGSDLASVPERYVQKYGPGPFAVCLTREDGSEARPGTGALLDLDQLSGARFYL
jgi:hypothetical protein